MDLFLVALRKEVRELHSNNIRLRIIGDRTVFGEVLVSAINEAENLTAENITAKRPGTGLSPMRWDEIIDSKAIKDYEIDELVL